MAVSSTSPIGEAMQKELSDAIASAEGNNEAQDYMSKVLQACSGHNGIKNAKDMLSDHVDDTVKEAEEHKANGNRLFAEARYDDALAEYEKAYALFCEYNPANLSPSAKKLLAAIHSNAAQACLKIATGKDGLERARMMADRALTYEPTNVKARYRRACAFSKLEDWGLAQDDLEHILRIEPENVAAKQELRNVLKQLRTKKDSGAWEKVAAAAIKTGESDPRIASSEKSAGETLVEKQVRMAFQLKAGVLQYYAKKGCLTEWEDKLKELQVQADELAEKMFKSVSTMVEAGQDLQSLLGQQGATLATLDSEQRRKFIEADSFITTVKGACGSDFKEIVYFASNMPPPKSK